jgi:hypothetical protein
LLTADYLDILPDAIVSLYSEYEDSVIFDIARRLKNLKLDSAAWQAQRLSESGLLYKDILKRLSRLTGKSEKYLQRIFKTAGVKTMAFDDSVYLKAGLKPLPLNLSPAMAEVLAVGLLKTNGVLRNLTLTTAVSGQEIFTHAADLAYMQVSAGSMDYISVLSSAVKNVATNGLQMITYPGGHRDRVDVAVRRAVLTGVSQTSGSLQLARADEMGVDLVETSAHAGARPSHAVWQGQIFSRAGTHPKYPPFVESTGYGTGAGLMGWNCRHSFYPFFEGISTPAYTEQQLKDLADKTVIYNDKKMSMYDATQYQRGIEREIRHWKRQKGALEAAGLEAVSETRKVRLFQAQMRDFVSQTGLIRQSEREIIFA